MQNGSYSSIISNGEATGGVTTSSSIYTYLHNTYYSNLSSVDEYIVKGATWNVGPVTYGETMLLNTMKDEEKTWTWSGKIGLMTASEYISAQAPSNLDYLSCLSKVYGNNACGENNWLIPTTVEETWTITPEYGANQRVLNIFHRGQITSYYNYMDYGVRPVVVLNSSIKLSGTGEQGDNAYKIIGSN